MRLPAVLLVVCLAVAGCGGGEEESSSGSSEPAQAVEGTSGPDYEAFDDGELCMGPFESWMKADLRANQELRAAAEKGSVDEATVEEILAPADSAVAALATAEDKELNSLATSYPELTKEFAMASVADDSMGQIEALEKVTKAKAEIIDRCLALSGQ